MPHDGLRAAKPAAVFVLALLGLVHVCGMAGEILAQTPKRALGQGTANAAKTAPDIRYGPEGLPAPVLEMRDTILSAVRSGKIEELRIAVELNEMKPAVSDQPVSDPIAHWRQVSGDGEGREILAIVGEILDAGYVTLPLGRDLENNRVYVWPYFAETALDRLTPAQEVELLRLVPAASLQEMKKSGRYTHYKLGIGADGTWHFFIR